MFNHSYGNEDFLMCILKFPHAVLAVSACPTFYGHEELLDPALSGDFCTA